MTLTINPQQVWAYLRKYWFRVSLLVLIILACFKKDWSFSFRLNSDKKEDKKKVNKKSETAAVLPVDEATPLSIFGNLLGGNTKSKEWGNLDEAAKIAFLQRFAQVAINERKKYGIPSSVILANALRQSFAGKADAAVMAQNYFALPCTFDWSGAQKEISGTCYRAYDNAWLSFRDHSVFITSGKFSSLRQLDAHDYKSWAKGLEKFGYPSVTGDLAAELIQIIETYNMGKLDKL